jgi:hypothetical protein
MKLFLSILFWLFSIPSFSAVYGTCIHDPNAKLLQEKWKHYLDVMKKKSHINSLVLVQEIKMDPDTLSLLLSISEVEKLIHILDEIELKYFKKAFVDLRFNEMIAHPDFLLKLQNKEVDQEIRTSELKFKNDSNFYDLLDQVRDEIGRIEVKNALALFRQLNLGILEGSYRKSAKSCLRLLRRRGGTMEAVRSWFNDPPFLRNVPYPSVQLGSFAIKYRSLVTKSVERFILYRKITLNDARLAYPRMKQSDVDEMNSIVPPTESNSFDNHISKIPVPSNLKLSQTDFSAIEGVVRTLWGEATSCQSLGLPQFEAIGRIIADRSLAVSRSLKDLKESEIKSSEVRKKNWITTLKNWVGLSRPAPGMLNKPVSLLRGLSDFGRKENSLLHPAAQVISKKGQFSVWNSFSIKKFHVGQFHKNIPDAEYSIQGPQSENDDMALVRILCPQTQTNEQIDLWNQAVKLAEDIVLRPETIQQNIKWPINEEILFYTHEAPLPFAREVSVSHISINNQKRFLRGAGKGPCHHFRLFVSKVKGQY